MKSAYAKVSLVNTRWNGKCERISLKNTRAIIDAILGNEINEVKTHKIPFFNLAIPKSLNNVPSDLLDPRSTWDSLDNWNKKANDLAKLFIDNFKKFCDDDHGKKLVDSGPQI